MWNYKRIYTGIAVGVAVWALTYRHFTLHFENVAYDYEAHHYAVMLHGKEMLESIAIGLVAFLTTTKIMSILDKKERK